MNISYIYKQLHLKDYLKRFLSHIRKILSFSSKLKYLNQKDFLFHMKKNNFGVDLTKGLVLDYTG